MRRCFFAPDTTGASGFLTANFQTVHELVRRIDSGHTKTPAHAVRACNWDRLNGQVGRPVRLTKGTRLPTACAGALEIYIEIEGKEQRSATFEHSIEMPLRFKRAIEFQPALPKHPRGCQGSTRYKARSRPHRQNLSYGCSLSRGAYQRDTTQ